MSDSNPKKTPKTKKPHQKVIIELERDDIINIHNFLVIMGKEWIEAMSSTKSQLQSIDRLVDALYNEKIRTTSNKTGHAPQ